ncbi:flagellar export chaperone FliS [Planosporangium mesophilum]|uniref:Flagellar protein FliS n=1 Tax=Planosporangium mesophilum TaxID=689768 RepID=A0A8J3TKA7_9ACTN|nr:flagellar export chaperone FliS [Planosporangium mesophilum]NJC86497.1 flagellar export chaperone FliS [Planosporangium mesophilum]GII26174.1 flagellar protein FliS [Planosporangium mesophilum]
MTNPALRARYLAQSVATASPGQLLVMLYDRLVVDLTQAEEALRAGDRETGSARLMHAQDIVAELRGTLDLSVWDGAAGLSQIYGFLLTQLIKANVRGDADMAASCRQVVEPLRDAWREALQLTQAAGAAAASAAGVAPVRVG